VWLGMLFAGTLADIDHVSVFLGPGAYFVAHDTFTHSLVGTAGVLVVAVWLTRIVEKKQRESLWLLLPPLACAAGVHLATDLLQSEGIELLWPFFPQRFAADWLPTMDLWIIVLLLVGIFVPELFHLIGAEIGVKDKGPRGRTGAILALSFVVCYVLARGALHANCVALLEPHTYHGQSARRVAAFPSPLSVVTWHGAIETQSLVCLVSVPATASERFDPEAAICLHKPEASAELSVAQESPLARAYLAATPFPRAAVARMPEGYEVEIRSLRDYAEGETRHRVAVRILIDTRMQISSERYLWVKDVSLR